MNKIIEIFKIIQRIIMVLLTIVLIYVMSNIAYEIRYMRKELNKANILIEQMKDNITEVTKSIESLRKTLKDSIWF